MATDTSAPPIVNHFHLIQQVPDPTGFLMCSMPVEMFLPSDLEMFKKIFDQDDSKYIKHTILPCRNRDCLPAPEPPKETTLDRLKIHVDSIADTLDTYGMTCFEQDEEVRNRNVWEDAEKEDLDIEFHEMMHAAECLYCDVRIELIDDYSALTCGTSDSCVDPCKHLAEVLARVEAASNAYMEVYDIIWTVAQDGDIMGVQLLVAGGGPNIYINTIEEEVQGFWAGDRYSRYISNAQDILEEFKVYAPENLQ